ncbi:MAG TPA: DinB family protein [Thermoanaerobaculia bacterium]|nr:DinB family protein [Thermoanaerobaculia bacterium]
MRAIRKPLPGEYPAYAAVYVDLLPDDGSILDQLSRNAVATRELVGALPEERLAFRYAPGKWTIKEIVAHLSDDERIYGYRALRFARNDATELPGFDQDAFARFSGANARPIDDLLAELEAVRRSTVLLFAGFDDAVLDRSGAADGNRFTVRALAYHIAGHELRHRNVIRERYLSGGAAVR